MSSPSAVDSWVLCDVCTRMGHPIEQWADDDESRFWRRLMLAEACRVKEAVFFEEAATFLLAPPGMVDGAGRGRPGSAEVALSRQRLVELLEQNGFYRSLEDCFDEMLAGGKLAAADVEH